MAGTNQTGRQTADGAVEGRHARRRRGIRLDVPNNELAITICSSDRTRHVLMTTFCHPTTTYFISILQVRHVRDWPLAVHTVSMSTPTHSAVTHYSVEDRL